MTLVHLVTVFASLSVALGATWTASDIKVTTLTGVSAISPSEVFGAMADNTLGPGLMHSTDSLKTSEYIGPAGGMNMDVAFTPNGKTGAMATVSGVLLTQDGKTFAKVADIVGVSQNVEAFGASSLGATGSFKQKSTKKQANGVAVTTDFGSTWNVYDIGLNSSYIARYGAFPTADTWYVSSGSWPASSEAVQGAHKLSARVHLNQFGADFKASKANSVSGYPGAISKTTDAGATWTQVFDSEGQFYFNEINCFDANSCVAVAENEEGALAVATTDAGATWKTVLTAPAGASLMGARMLSATEAWVSGGAQESRTLYGYYYHTTDAGATWELSKLANAYSMDLSFSNGVGYSAALNSAYSTIAIYN